jgi:hypothetical protein
MSHNLALPPAGLSDGGRVPVEEVLGGHLEAWREIALEMMGNTTILEI